MPGISRRGWQATTPCPSHQMCLLRKQEWGVFQQRTAREEGEPDLTLQVELVSVLGICALLSLALALNMTLIQRIRQHAHEEERVEVRRSTSILLMVLARALIPNQRKRFFPTRCNNPMASITFTMSYSLREETPAAVHHQGGEIKKRTTKKSLPRELAVSTSPISCSSWP